MSLTTVTGLTAIELADEIWEALDILINERLYENSVAEEDVAEFKNQIATLLIENLEENL
tara:strand:+ start:920 stop:1099 length:180 start_codon:yes stop_codon:yes gene_type:complete